MTWTMPASSIDLRGRDRDAGVEVADDHLHAFSGELVRHRHALLGIGDVVADDDLQLLAIDAAGGIDVLDRLLDAVLQLRAESGVRAGDGAGDADLDLRVGRAGKGETKTERNAGQQHFFHEVLLWVVFVGPLQGDRFGEPRLAGRVTSCLFLSGSHAGISDRVALRPLEVLSRRRIFGSPPCAPAERAGALVEPAVLGGHQPGPVILVTERCR